MDWKLELVIVYISDVDRARDRLYRERWALTLDVDHRASDHLGVILADAAGSTCSISIGIGLSDRGAGLRPRDAPGRHRHRSRARRACRARCRRQRDLPPGAGGKEVRAGPRGADDYGSFLSLQRNPDGNSWVSHKDSGFVSGAPSVMIAQKQAFRHRLPVFRLRTTRNASIRLPFVDRAGPLTPSLRQLPLRRFEEQG